MTRKTNAARRTNNVIERLGLSSAEVIYVDGERVKLEWQDPLGLRGCGFFHIQNDKIIFQRGYWDKLSFLKQHGLPIPH